MVEVISCHGCGEPLSYGEQFRHRLAVEVAWERPVSIEVLGDRLSPRRPQALCGPCRDQASHIEFRPVERQSNRQMLTALAGILLLCVIVAS